VRQGDVPANALGEINLTDMKMLSVSIPEGGSASKVIIDELSVRSVGAFHTGLTPDLTVQQWAQSVLHDLCNSSYSFDVAFVDDDVDVYLGSFVSDGQAVISAISANGVTSFVDFALGVVVNGHDLTLWKACLALKLMPVERYTDLISLHRGQLGLESEWFCKLVLLETALANGLSYIVRDLVLARTTANNSRSSYILEDVARVERWIDESKQNIEALLNHMLDTQLSPYLLRKAALTYEPVTGQFSSIPIAVSSALQMRLSIIDSITVVMGALQARKQADALTVHVTAGEFRSKRLNLPPKGTADGSLTRNLSLSMSATQTRHNFSNTFTSTTNPSLTMPHSNIDAANDCAFSALERQMMECQCIANCFRVIIIAAKHPNLSLRCCYPSRLSSSFPSKSLLNIRVAQAAMLKEASNRYLPEQCQFSDSLLRCLLERALLATPDNVVAQLLGNWDNAGLLVPSNFSESDCNSWICSLFQLPMAICRSHHGGQQDVVHAMNFAYMVLIYQIIDALWVTMMGDPHNLSSGSHSSSSNNLMSHDMDDLRVPGSRSRDRRECLGLLTDLNLVLGTAVNIPFAHQRLLLSMWKIENCVDMENAVKDLTTGPACLLVRADADLVKEIICKGLAWELHNTCTDFMRKAAFGHRQPGEVAVVDTDRERVLGHGVAFQLISYFNTTSTTVATALKTSTGAMLLLATYLQPQCWEDGWNWVRAYIIKFSENSVRADAQRAVTEVLCRWTREFGLFGTFLLKAMNDIVS
jgi:hypothetical protein